MSHRALAFVSTLLLSFLLARPAVAQEQPAMLATAEYLFVVRGEWLFQFDVHTLELKNRRRLEGGEAPLKVEEVTEAIAVEEVEEVTEAIAVEEVTEAIVVEEVQDGPIELGGGAGGRYGGRGGRAGAKAPTDEAVDAGLKWLAAHQDENGRWDCDGFMKHDGPGDVCTGAGNAVHDVGATGLALLAFLGSGNTLRSGPYKEQVKKGVKWLRSQQQINGLFGSNASHDFIYDHAIATYAMCEAYGLSNYKLLQSCAQQGLDYLESHRNPYAVWRYQPRGNDNDTSVTSWCLMALKSGEFFGLKINPNALKLGLAYLDQVTTADGRCGYTQRGEVSSRMPGAHKVNFPPDKCETLTAAGLWCRFFLDQNPKDTPVMKAAADRILASPVMWDEDAGTIDHYYWYYATYAMYQMGGRYWQRWAHRMLPEITKHQRKEGHAAGSWDPSGVWGESGGRIYSTALMTLTLQAYYRYTKLLR